MSLIPSSFQSKSISDNVYTELKKAIISGQLSPDERLIVLDIAGRYGISQAPVREALERLKQEGLIIGRTNKGSVVAPISAKEIKDLYVLREIIEGFAVRESMQRMSEDDYTYLDQVLEQMEQAVQRDDMWEILMQDMEFHGFFYRKCDNAAVLDLWERMKNKVIRFMALSNRYYSTENLVDWHMRLIEALRTGEAAIAEAKFIEHMHAYKELPLE